MEITAALATDLALLTDALDEPGADLAETLRRLAAAASVAVQSYLGLSVIAGDGARPVTFTALEATVVAADIGSSLRMPLSQHTARPADSRLVVIFYARRPGAFVDLAADLSSLTGLRLIDFVLDDHLRLPASRHPADTVLSSSVVNQAVGLLLGRGYTPERAAHEIDVRAATAGHSRFEAAQRVLTDPPGGDPDR
ncbi:MAG: hypothetical protein QOH89_2762 [Pseudonocardiales bacterium]|nr:hypothetical protein [Pseudonocardiales bacterium]MDT4941954.1 hypothetical protein [Pseudonocardiales bacterium]